MTTRQIGGIKIQPDATYNDQTFYKSQFIHITHADSVLYDKLYIDRFPLEQLDEILSYNNAESLNELVKRFGNGKLEYDINVFVRTNETMVYNGTTYQIWECSYEDGTPSGLWGLMPQGCSSTYLYENSMYGYLMEHPGCDLMNDFPRECPFVAIGSGDAILYTNQALLDAYYLLVYVGIVSSAIRYDAQQFFNNYPSLDTYEQQLVGEGFEESGHTRAEIFNDYVNNTYTVPGGAVGNIYMHIEGCSNSAYGFFAPHVEGYINYATNNSHAEGNYTSAYSPSVTTSSGGTHTEGSNTLASQGAHAEGYLNKIHDDGIALNLSCTASHAEGRDNTVYEQGHAEGAYNLITATTRVGDWCHVEGTHNYVSGSSYCHVEGSYCSAKTSTSVHVEGSGNSIESVTVGHVEGYGTSAYTYAGMHVEGLFTLGSGNSCHVEGNGCRAVSGEGIHCEGYYNNYMYPPPYLVNGAHFEGYQNSVTGTSDDDMTGRYCYAAHIEGSNNLGGAYSHVEGYGNKVTLLTHVEGTHNTVWNSSNAYVSGVFIGGSGCTADTMSVNGSFIFGDHLLCKYGSQFIFGRYNATASSDSSKSMIYGKATGTTRITGFTITTGGTINKNSDRRLKEEIADIDKHVINSLKNIKFQQFRWKREIENEKTIEGYGVAKTNYGIIAQDAISALSDNGVVFGTYDIINDDGGGRYLADYEQFLVCKCASYEDKISELESVLDRLSNRLKVLEAG